LAKTAILTFLGWVGWVGWLVGGIGTKASPSI
jgi:hypothetical protein